MNKINLKDYVANNASIFAECKIKWFTLGISKIKSFYIVTIISAMRPKEPINKIFDTITEANEFFGKTIYKICK